MTETEDFDKLIKRLERTYKVLPRQIGTVAVNFSKDRFKQQNWLDSGAQPWAKRKPGKRTARRSKGAILVSTGRLRRSIRKIRESEDGVMIGTDVPYAQIHNEGLKVDGTFRVKAHTRKAHTRNRNGRKEKVSEHSVSGHSRTVKFKMPQRQFLGQSAALEKDIEDLVEKQIKKALSGE